MPGCKNEPKRSRRTKKIPDVCSGSAEILQTRSHSESIRSRCSQHSAHSDNEEFPSAPPPQPSGRHFLRRPEGSIPNSVSFLPDPNRGVGASSINPKKLQRDASTLRTCSHVGTSGRRSIPASRTVPASKRPRVLRDLCQLRRFRVQFSFETCQVSADLTGLSRQDQLFGFPLPAVAIAHTCTTIRRRWYNSRPGANDAGHRGEAPREYRSTLRYGSRGQVSERSAGSKCEGRRSCCLQHEYVPGCARNDGP